LNLSGGGEGPAKISDEYRAKLSAVHKGKPLSESHKAALRKPRRPMNDAARANMRRVMSVEQRAQVSARHTGKTWTDEGLANLRAARERQVRPVCADETKKKIGNANRGRVKTPEEIAKRLATLARKKQEKQLGAPS
jgi:hypothetical protein